MKKIYLYTDGACSGNPGPGGCAAIAYDEKGKELYRYGYGYERTTNNRMELFAAACGLFAMTKDVKSSETDVVICSDSAVLVNTMTQGWKRKANTDIWNSLDKVTELYHSVEYRKVKGHADDECNQAADKLAVWMSSSKNRDKLHDTGYERQNPEKPEEATIREIRLMNVSDIENRKVEVDLSNGTTVTIEALYEGFQQYNCNKIEAAITLSIAQKFNNWLHGKKL